jgi:Uma2 family endonuclease
MAVIATPVRIGPTDQGRRMTFQEFVEADVEEGYRYELSQGVLEVTQVANDLHRQVVSNLYKAVALYDSAHSGIVLAFGGGAEFQLLLPGLRSGRNPDLCVVLRGATKDRRGRTLPALAAEVVSPGSVKRDYETKREEYLAFGLLEYWIVDPLSRQVTVLTRRGDTWHEVVLRDEQVIASLVLPGFTTVVAALWVDVEDEEEDAIDSGASGL